MTANLGGVSLTQPLFIDESHMMFSYTSDTTGAKTLEIDNTHQAVTVENAFVVYPPDISAVLSLDAIYPAQGKMAGGNDVTLTEVNISNATTVRIRGGDTLTGDAIEVIGNNQIRVEETPSASVAGAVTVEVATRIRASQRGGRLSLCRRSQYF